MDNRRILNILCAAMAITQSIIPASMASTGSLSIDSSGFLKSANDDRPGSSTTVIINPVFQQHGKYFYGKVDVKGVAFLSDYSSFTFESPEAYISTGPRLSRRNELSFGRRKMSWSRMDDEWQLGLWSPRFLWDPLHPEQIGMTGFFYRYESPQWKVQVFASPLTVPERTFPVKEENGALISSSPLWKPLPSRLMLSSGQEIDIRYRINQPSIGEVLINPALAVRVRYGEKYGGFVGGSAGVMPMHQSDLQVKASLMPGSDTYVDAALTPKFPLHQIATLEGGYQAKDWSVWGSLSGENPIDTGRDPGVIANPIGRSWIASSGGSFRSDDGFRLSSAVLVISEKTTQQKNTSSIDVDLDVPPRFSYTKAVRLGAEWSGYSPLSYGLNWTYDVDQLSGLISADLTYAPNWNKNPKRSEQWSVGLGADFISSATGSGWIGQYQGHDRIRGRLAYAF